MCSIWLSLPYRGRKTPGVRFPATLSCRAAAVVWRLALLCQYVSDGAFRPPSGGGKTQFSSLATVLRSGCQPAVFNH